MEKAVIAIAAASSLLAGCSGDLTVRNDVGERVIVKKSTVKAYPYGNRFADNYLRDSAQKAYKTCLEAGGKWCEEIHKKYADKEIERNKPIQEWLDKDITLRRVKFRTISVDLNGYKKVSGYKVVYCMPDDFNWINHETVKRAQKVMGFNLVTPANRDRTFEDRVELEVCERFGR